MRTECESDRPSYDESIADPAPTPPRRTWFLADVDARALCAAALGGVIGAALRWLVSLPYDLARDEFPWDGLTVNLLGSLAIGIAATRMVRGSVGWAFAVTGILGGFTTMSGFALAFSDLIRADRPSAAIVYLAVTMTGGVVAVLVGENLAARRRSA